MKKVSSIGAAMNVDGPWLEIEAVAVMRDYCSHERLLAGN